MCGILGFCAQEWDPALAKFFGLQGFNLQHRGQENFGCTYSNGKKFNHFKDKGLVSQVLPADEISSATEAEARRFANIPANQLALNKLLINQAYENMGLRTSQMLGTFFDGMTRHTEEAYQWTEEIAERGFKPVIADRDGPWQDYSQRPDHT